MSGPFGETSPDQLVELALSIKTIEDEQSNKKRCIEVAKLLPELSDKELFEFLEKLYEQDDKQWFFFICGTIVALLGTASFAADSAMDLETSAKIHSFMQSFVDRYETEQSEMKLNQ